MDANQHMTLEEQLRMWSQELPYPTTPDIAGAVAHRLKERAEPRGRPHLRLVWALVAILLVLGALMAVPAVRAQVLEYLQIGAIRIFLTAPTPTATQAESQVSPPSGIQGNLLSTATPGLSLRTYPSIADLAGETSLDEAQSKLDFPIRKPEYPPDLGEPERVFLQDLGGLAVLLVWMEPGETELIRLDLLQMGPDTFARKSPAEVIEETSVQGRPAIWTEGPHLLHLGGNKHQYVPLVVKGNILIWEQDGITYRLESNLTLEEAVKVADSLE
jgi:hypothetical protein